MSASPTRSLSSPAARFSPASSVGSANSPLHIVPPSPHRRRRCCGGFAAALAVLAILSVSAGALFQSGLLRRRDVGARTQRLGRSARADRILCLVPSRWPPSARLRTIKETWGSHCDRLVFTAAHSAAANGAYGVEIEQLDVSLDVTDDASGGGRDLWTVTHKAWTYVYERWGSEYDWFLKTDDDSFFIAENLRRFVAEKRLDPQHAYYLGHTVFSADIPANLGAGYVLSHEALRRVAPNLPSSPQYAGRETGCTPTGTWAEDNKLARCLHEIGIKPFDSRDVEGRERFMPFTPIAMLHTVRKQNSSGWFWRRKPRNTQSGVNCCARYPILWHGLKGPEGARKMRALYHLSYNSRVHRPAEEE